MPTKEELKSLVSQPLDAKILLSKRRIREWYNYWGGYI